MDMMPGMGMMGGWMLLWVLVGIAVLVVAVLTAVWLVKQLSAGRRDTGNAAEEQLQRRYVAGEIDREEFLRIRRDLAGD